MSKLTPKQQRFVDAYMKGMNATRAAIRAGYSPRSAYSTGERMLRNAEVGAEVERLIAERIERTGVEADRGVEELARLAFSDLREHVEWGPNRVVQKESEGLTDEAAATEAAPPAAWGPFSALRHSQLRRAGWHAPRRPQISAPQKMRHPAYIRIASAPRY